MLQTLPYRQCTNTCNKVTGALAQHADDARGVSTYQTPTRAIPMYALQSKFVRSYHSVFVVGSKPTPSDAKSDDRTCRPFTAGRFSQATPITLPQTLTTFLVTKMPRKNENDVGHPKGKLLTGTSSVRSGNAKQKSPKSARDNLHVSQPSQPIPILINYIDEFNVRTTYVD